MAIRWPLNRSKPAASAAGTRTVLLASEGRRFTPEAIKFAAHLARREGGGDGGHVRVLTVARLWGTGLGLPNPGLRPSKSELAEQEENVRLAIRQLEKMGIKADGNIVVTRDPRKSILRETRRLGCEAIVMGADNRRPWLIADFMWSQAPYRVARRAPVPCHIVVAGAKT